jgi:hypothetical protein
MYKVITALALAIVGGIIYWLWSQSRPPPAPPSPPPPPVAAPAPPPPDVKPEAKIQHPIERSPEERLPALDESDRAMRHGMTGLFRLKRLDEVFFLEGIIRRVVATVDALPREQVALDVWPVKPTPGEFQVDGDVARAGAVLTPSPTNPSRYASRIRLAESVDPRTLVDFYTRHYPLFQRAYQELGYPKGYFNDRLIEAIDDLLATPDPDGPLRLSPAGAHYAFADPDLQMRSAGQKILLRMGPQQAARVKTVLRKIRRELTR